MAFDLITGKRGTGKSKLAAVMIKEHLEAGRLVATNLDLKLEKLLSPMSRAVCIRVPDKPTYVDLVAMGNGNNGDRYNEDDNGLLVLDELATWLNARTFQDKDRGPVIDYLVHSRKHGWECAFICQDMVQIDKQVRESLVEYVIRCTRFDKMRIPVIGGIAVALLGEKRGTLPKGHRAVRRLGCDPKGIIARGWWYKTGGVQEGYDTLQVFKADYPHGAHSMLSPWHLVGRFLPPQRTWWQRVSAALGFAPGAKRQVQSPKLPIVAKIMRLDAHERLRHVQRLERLGLLGGDRQGAMQ